MQNHPQVKPFSDWLLTTLVKLKLEKEQPLPLRFRGE